MPANEVEELIVIGNWRTKVIEEIAEIRRQADAMRSR